MSDIVERLRQERPQFYESLMREAAAEIERLRAEINEWRDCARYDPLMSGPAFKGWNRSQMDRCRKRYIEEYKREVAASG